MIDSKDWLEFGQKFHGHKCPAMPMGLRVGAAAMNALGVERAKDGQLIPYLPFSSTSSNQKRTVSIVLFAKNVAK